ncbi:hypothetical protein HaLaN_06751, partial [Haematococcus lacustris]
MASRPRSTAPVPHSLHNAGPHPDAGQERHCPGIQPCEAEAEEPLANTQARCSFGRAVQHRPPVCLHCISTRPGWALRWLHLGRQRTGVLPQEAAEEEVRWQVLEQVTSWSA